MSQSLAPRRPRLSAPMIAAFGLLALVLVGFAACQLRSKTPKDPYRTAGVERGSITRTVSASGTLEALVTVDVGSQISGQIRRVLVDFNDPVRRGQLLAELDPQTYVSRVAQGQADVAAGQAALRQAQAQAANAQADFERKQVLVAKGVYSPSALDLARAAQRETAAGVNAARARIAQSQAALQANRVDLGRTTIVAPIDGIIIDRKVEPGNTVAASLQAPVLFTIAQDLSKVQVKINVDEADVGQVHEGQLVRFTVDAFPDETFQGLVTQLRKQPTTDQNVVSYTVMAEADNPRGQLLPGMTANADIIIDRRDDVLKVPSAALRWTPPDAQRPGAGAGAGGGGASSFGAGGGGGAGGGARGGGGYRQGGGGQRGGGMAARLVEQLGLDGSQRKAWEKIQGDLRQKNMALFASAGGDRSQMRETLRKNTEEALAKLEPLLKPEQKTRLAAVRATMGQGRGRGAGMRGGVVYVLKDGKPSPVAVRVGASDGSNTEIAGPLKPGDQVIVGGGPRPKAQARAPFGGPGMGGPGGGPGGGMRGGGGMRF